MRAAEYVRVSTDLQQYSIVNQQAAIVEYAAQHNFEIVKTYSDPAKSGLDIKHRPGLQSLIDDVLGGRADFQAVLVFDISRWGRFQDGDEAACYEFLCRRAGIAVHYCAEPFPNDGSSASLVLKMVKRAMAAEYSRELSAKTHAGQCRLVAIGFKIGGIAGFGLRRLLLDSKGQPKMVLQEGEHKNLATDRVTYTLGPDEEVRVVREIYSMFLDQNMSRYKIARLLNERGIKYGKFGSWTFYRVDLILTHPKYTGCIVFNRTSAKLKSKVVYNSREQWVVRPDTFPAIVSQDVFNRVQAKLDNSVNRRSDERLLVELKTYIQTHGKPLPVPAHVGNLAAPSTYVRRFGGWMRAYEKIQYQPARYTPATLEKYRRVAALRMNAMAELRQAFLNNHVRFVEGKMQFNLRGRGRFLLEVARSYTTKKGIVRWTVHSKRLSPKYGVIVNRLQQGNSLVKDFVILPKVPRTTWGFWLSDELVEQAGTICRSAGEVVGAIIAARP